MIAPGDEVQEGARSDDVGDSEAKVHCHREDAGMDKTGPEKPTGHFERNSGDPLTQFQSLDNDNDRYVDRASHHEAG